MDLTTMPDLILAAELARLDNQTGGNLRARQIRADMIRALEGEQDRRTAERLWALPVAREVS